MQATSIKCKWLERGAGSYKKLQSAQRKALAGKNRKPWLWRKTRYIVNHKTQRKLCLHNFLPVTSHQSPVTSHRFRLLSIVLCLLYYSDSFYEFFCQVWFAIYLFFFCFFLKNLLLRVKAPLSSSNNDFSIFTFCYFSDVCFLFFIELIFYIISRILRGAGSPVPTFYRLRLFGRS